MFLQNRFLGSSLRRLITRRCPIVLHSFRNSAISNSNPRVSKFITTVNNSTTPKYWDRCVLPTAIKPWQKAVCAVSGVTLTIIGGIGTAFLGVYTLVFMDSIIATKIGGFLCGSVMTVLGSFTSYAYIKVNPDYPGYRYWMSQIRGTTHCCDIVRATAIFTGKSIVRLAFIGFGTCFALGGVGLILDSICSKPMVSEDKE